MAAEASGAFDAVVSGQSIPLNIDTRVRAYWWGFLADTVLSGDASLSNNRSSG